MNEIDDNHASDSELPEFSPIEARILACLMEKQLTTPDNYPLTVNSLTLACNQKSNREPVMKLTEGEVGHTVNQLAARDLLRIEYGERTNRIAHRMNLAFTLNDKQRALMTVLMLRQPQTLNDIRARTQRMVEFEDLNEIGTMLEELTRRRIPLVKHLAKGAGQREDRYTHLMCGEVEAPEAKDSEPVIDRIPSALPESMPEPKPGVVDALERRITALEEQVSALLERLD